MGKYIPDDSRGCNKMYYLSSWTAVLTHMNLASNKKRHREKEQTQIKTPQISASDLGLHCLLHVIGNHIRNRMKMKQDLWQHLSDKWIRPIDKDGRFY